MASAWTARVGLGILFLSAAPALAEEEYRLAINVEVARGLPVTANDLVDLVAARAGEYPRVKPIPGNKIQEALSEARSEINQKCRSGQLDAKCQISLGTDLGATYWLQVAITRLGKSCNVRVSCLSMQRQVQEAGALESSACTPEELVEAIGRGLEKIAMKLDWGLGSSLAPAPAREAAPDPLADARKQLAEEKAQRAREALETKRAAEQRRKDAERSWPEVARETRDRSASVESRQELVHKFLEAFNDTPRAKDARAVLAELQAERAQTLEGEREAKSVLGGIMVSQRSFFAEYDNYAACAVNGGDGRTPTRWATQACSAECSRIAPEKCTSFSCLGYAPPKPVRYRYACNARVAEANQTAEVTCAAAADLDGNGKTKMFVYGSAHADGMTTISVPIPPIGDFGSCAVGTTPAGEIVDCNPREH